MLTEMYLCHACSYHEIEDGNARTGRHAVGHSQLAAEQVGLVVGLEPRAAGRCAGFCAAF
eukprot:COSAG01_NODE_185_length_22691_cov_53.142478_17_plen_60_part_00